MPNILSRRRLLGVAGGGALALALGTSLASRAEQAAALTPDALDALRERWVDQITGRTLLDPADPDFAAALARLDRAVATSRARLSAGAARTAVFDDLPLDRDTGVRTTFARLAQLATAWATPGSARAGDAAVLAEVVAGLADAHRLVYNAGQEEFGNWWSWEIGAAKDLADTMALLGDRLGAQEVADYTAALDHFVADPWYQYPDSRGKIVSTGANRVDLCQAVIVRSIVGRDPERLAHAVAGLAPVSAPVEQGDGFYADGSFVQHSTIPYTGTYGVVLLGGLAKLFTLLADSDAAVDDVARRDLDDTVEQTFAPFVHDEQVLDCVRGRAVSRAQERSHDDGHITVEAVLQLAGSVPAATGDRWRGLCRGWIERNRVDPVLDGASVVRTALVKDLLASDVAALPEQRGPRLFARMDRVTHCGDGWALALAMCSRRTAWYECGNGENELAYHSGSGMTYVYGADAAHFDDGFWPTADLTRLPGTTVDTTRLPPKVEGEWGARTPDNRWAGGVALDGHALVGHDLRGPGGTGLVAHKSWFLGDSMVVCLGAGIRTGTSAHVESVVEQRNLGEEGRNVLLVDGRPFRVEDRLQGIGGARWAHLEGVGGYVFLERGGLRALRERRTGSWRRINATGPDEELERRYVTLLVDHGAAPTDGSYAYVLLPGADARRTAREAVRPSVRVLANTADVQALSVGTVEAANFFAPGEAGRWVAETPAAVLASRTDRGFRVAVADPTQSLSSVTVGLRLDRGSRVAAPRGVSARRRGDVTLLQVATGGRAGEPVVVDVDA